MRQLKADLSQRLRGAKKIVVLGVGSELRGDDAAGLLVADRLKGSKLNVISGGTAPENFTGEIKKLKPSHLIIVDAAQIKSPPGTIKLINLEEIGGYSFSTHALPLKVLAEFILNAITCDIIIIAIQPRTLEFGAAPSPEVEAAAKLIGDVILSGAGEAC
jgi:hydrogenase 3 maturation protease